MLCSFVHLFVGALQVHRCCFYFIRIYNDEMKQKMISFVSHIFFCIFSALLCMTLPPMNHPFLGSCSNFLSIMHITYL